MDSTSGARYAPLTPDGILPPAILSNEPGTWAHDTVSRRLRENILSRVFSDNAAMLARDPAAEAALRALDAELSDAANATIRAIHPDGGPDVRAWNDTLAAPWIGTSWLDTPWLASEFYFYRRILEALGYFGDGPCAQMDPFQRDKDAGLEACVGAVGALAPRLNEYASAPGVEGVLAGARLFVLVSLWGNRMDLSIWPAGGAAAAGDDGESSSAARAADAFNEALTAGERCLLHDDSAAAAAALLEPGRDRVGLVVDNAGFELVCDLALADALVCARDRTNASANADADGVSARVTVTLHVKAHPVFVSDAMDKDVRATVDAMCASDDDEVARMGRRWRGHLTSGAWVIKPQFAWSQPQPFWELPREARASLAEESAVIIKGDANYRRLLGDRLWDLDAPFSDVAAYFPAPLLALRTLKAELGCGIPPEQAARAAAENPEGWMTSGEFGVVQWLPRPARQADVASLAWSWDATQSTPEERRHLARVLVAISNACAKLAARLAAAPLRASDSIGVVSGSVNATGDAQKKLDVVANQLIREALRECGSASHYCSEEEEGVVTLASGGRFVVVCDPLDGSRNVDCGVPTGTIFGVYRRLEGADDDDDAQATQRGVAQVAAGYANYSSSTAFVAAVAGGGPAVELDLDDEGEFRVAAELECPTRGQIYSLNDARFGDWPEGLRDYVSDVRAGKGQTGKQYSARYVCSLVTDFHRTLHQGGWCGNPRPHLRLTYECNPLAFVARAAGGAATDGAEDILNKTPRALHERTPLFMGSAEDIAEIATYGDVQQGAAEYAV